MLRVLELTLPLFALVFCGFFGQRWKLLPDNAVAGINAFVFHFALPAMLFRVVATQPLGVLHDWRFILGYALAGLVVFAFMRLARLAGEDEPRRTDPTVRSEATIFGLNVAHGNVGYMGIPLGIELGQRVLPTLVVAIVVDFFLIITLSIALLEIDRKRAANTDSGRDIWRTVGAGLARSPIVLAIAAGLAWTTGVTVTGAQTPMPDVLDNFTRILGGAAGPSALFAIGASLGNREVKLSRQVLGLASVKLLLHPTLAAVLLYFVFEAPHDAAATGVLVASLPSAGNSFILATRYGVPQRDVSASIVLGTFAALATVSATIWALGLRSGV